MSSSNIIKVNRTNNKPLKNLKSVNFGCSNSPKRISARKKQPLYNLQKYFDKRLTGKSFGTELKNVKNQLKSQKVKYSPYLNKPLYLKQYYYLLANPYIDENGEIIPVELYNVHMKYMVALYSKDLFVQQYIFITLTNGSKDILPSPEYSQLLEKDIEFLIIALNVNSNDFIFFDFFKASLSKQDYDYYVYQCVKFMTTPFLDPQNNKKWKSDIILNDENYIVNYAKLPSFVKTLRLAIPYLRVLQLQDVINNQQKYKEKDIFNIIDNGVMCISSNRYSELYSHIAIYKLFLAQIFNFLDDETKDLLFTSYELTF